MTDLRRFREAVVGLHTVDGLTVEELAKRFKLTKTQVELILIAWGPRGTE